MECGLYYIAHDSHLPRSTVLYGLETWPDLACIYYAWSRPFTVTLAAGTETDVPRDEVAALMGKAQKTTEYGSPINCHNQRRPVNFELRIIEDEHGRRSPEIYDDPNGAVVMKWSNSGSSYRSRLSIYGDMCIMNGVERVWVIDVVAIRETSGNSGC